MKRTLILLSLLLLPLIATPADDEHKSFQIFRKDGTPASYDEMLQKTKSYDIVCFGEQHNCPVAHWLELRIAKDLFTYKKGSVQLGFEMFESDRQIVLDEYMGDLISQNRFEAEGKLWPNYSTDYAPIIEWAKKEKVQVFATNVPRRYANSVSHKGVGVLNSFPEEVKQWIAPLPIRLESGDNAMMFHGMLEMLGEDAASAERAQRMGAAQSLKDATMAWFITKNKKQDYLFIHYNGSQHSNNNAGIITYISQYAPSLKTTTIATVRQENISSLAEDNRGIADYIIVIPDDFPLSY